MFNPEELRAIAKQKKNPTIKTEEIVYDPDKINTIIKDMEDHVSSFAQEGSMSVNYKFLEEHSLHYIKHIASVFKHKHPKLFILNSEGEKLLTISWAGNNYV